MPKRIDETNKSESIQLRLDVETRQRCANARLAGSHKLESEASFFSYLIDMGLIKYEKTILPIERGDYDFSVTSTIGKQS